LGRYAEPYRTRRTLEKKDKIWREYKVPLPDKRILFVQLPNMEIRASLVLSVERNSSLFGGRTEAGTQKKR